MRSYQAIVLVIAVLVGVLAAPLRAGAAEPYDCNLLLRLFYTALNSVIDKEPNTTLIELAKELPVPRSAEYLHREVYKLLLDVALIEKTLKEYQENNTLIPRQLYLSLLTRLYTAINSLESSIDSYTDVLLRCVHGKTYATIMSIEIGLLKKKIPSLLYSLEGEILSLAYPGSADAKITLEPRVIPATNPRILICISSPSIVPGEYRVETITVLGRSPGNVKLSYHSVAARNHTICVNETLSLGGARPPRITFLQDRIDIPVWFIVKASSNQSIIGPVLVKSWVEYLSPIKSIKVPSIARYGENISITIEPRIPVNVSIAIGDKRVEETLLETNKTVLNISTKGLEIGYHTLTIRVLPLVNKTLYPVIEYSTAIAIEAKPPKVRIIVDNPAISFANIIKLTIINLGEEPVRVKTRLGFTNIDDIVFDNMSFNLYALPNPLPWVYRLNITIASANSTASISYEEQVLLINPLGIVLVAAIAALLAMARDSLDLARLVALTAPAIRRGAARSAEVVEAYYEKLRIKIRKSVLAAAYYSMLRRLGIPLPEPPETLREHWRRAVRGLDTDSKLYNTMLQAEKDLYSRNKLGVEESSMEGLEEQY